MQCLGVYPLGNPPILASYPRDGMLAQYMLWPCVCSSVCYNPAVYETAGWSSFFRRGFPRLTYVALEGSSDTPKKIRLVLLPSELKYNCGSPPHVDHRKCCQLSSTDDRRQFITLNIHLRRAYTQQTWNWVTFCDPATQ